MAETTAYLPAQTQAHRAAIPAASPPVDLAGVIEWVADQGYVFEPWQIAAYMTAVRTKPFVILAGISGTGKSRLPTLVAKATGAECTFVEVQPNWTDSDDLLGFERLDGTWCGGPLLEAVAAATANPSTQHFFVLDEMNIARVEYYLAEVLSVIERRSRNGQGQIVGPVVAPNSSADPSPANGIPWNQLTWPANLTLVGSVNMDETTFGFSRKVLDRAFVIEFSIVSLDQVGQVSSRAQSANWPSNAWEPQALDLASHPDNGHDVVKEAIDALVRINTDLQKAQMQVGYRTRDEIALFCLNAMQSRSAFMTAQDGDVDPLDLAIAMKVLPRIQGGGERVRAVLNGLLRWAEPESGSGTAYPFCADRLRMMRQRIDESGFTSFWL